ncbi:DUF2062 domain-containing protein [Haloterrigena sp. SYSU A558-1]|uniref:DUF2062 domain-containing protein n=1 Tax=Haloterrigena gelatinilytica TaxID=2741724 RepID=A0A8J8GKQ6_9EURY|nr:DUF2062 domain-containing protein [Haloterrigena gelatinilytica]NUB91411.1 DUF2062 domain-containing protein [Haloterrigena gelatinilytica]NUC72851.1 DUF2062 domain-containing protein [Haloterrigena gelatinilytica]
MVRERLARYRDRIRRKLVAAFREEHTPHQIAASFAIGIFVTALPTGGLGVGLFFVLVSLQAWISKPAIFASVAVLNPVVKPAVYLSSFQVGAVLLGSDSVASRDALSGELARVAIRQLVLGNVVIAVGLAVVGYVLLRYVTQLHRRRSDRFEAPAESGIFGNLRR